MKGPPVSFQQAQAQAVLQQAQVSGIQGMRSAVRDSRNKGSCRTGWETESISLLKMLAVSFCCYCKIPSLAGGCAGVGGPEPCRGVVGWS